MTRTGNQHIKEVKLPSLSVEPIHGLLEPEQSQQLKRDIERGRKLLSGRVVWNINSTAVGGGVAEMLQSLLAYARGAGIDAHWLVIHGDAPFFAVTKRLHNFLHGHPGDGGELGDAERQAYARAMAANARELLTRIRRGDVVILHDPQTAGLIPHLKATGAVVVWRSHVGAESVNEYVARGWDFLRPVVTEANAYVFSRNSYVPPEVDRKHARIIPPSIDPCSPKNQDRMSSTWVSRVASPDSRDDHRGNDRNSQVPGEPQMSVCHAHHLDDPPTTQWQRPFRPSATSTRRGHDDVRCALRSDTPR